jgi:hypothetical protein
MARLNRMGRHITISSRTQQLRVAAPNKRKQHLVLALQSVNGQCYLSVIHPSYRKYVESLLLRAPMIATHHWIISEDDYFNDFPQSRSLRARRVTKERYTQTKEEINRKV